MTTTVDAIYESGKLLLPKPLSLPEKSRVRVTIESDVEREAWLKLSEDNLSKTWAIRTTTFSMNCSRNNVVLLPIPFTGFQILTGLNHSARRCEERATPGNR